ncbi:MAG: Chk1 protein kinase [Trizodia sp. TS-e1964]|nr:MAG: Chk1 protein kinase [Trizodia sp. TS-e1964]
MSQLPPLPDNLPFRVISKAIGRGAYATIKKAAPLESDTPIFAVKFIHKAYAVGHGRITQKQIFMEVRLHKHIGSHQNIIEFYSSDEDNTWRWIAMEFAEGGDLFDKIEADVGVSEDVAHFYFTQLVAGVSFMHSRGVGHRDIKPENILLSDSGNLKLADFGLATLFLYEGRRKSTITMCGSPPYIAPEVIRCGKSLVVKEEKQEIGYAPDLADMWSCGVVLFVLLVGNTPWDEPTANSWEYEAYVEGNGKSEDELWKKPPPETLSLLRGMMKIDPSSRFTFEDVRRHPWYTRSNPYLSDDGKSNNPVSLATTMLENLKIDFSQDPTASQMASRHRLSGDAMDIDAPEEIHTRFAATQPEAPINDVLFEWERPPRIMANIGWSASQPVRRGPKPSAYNAARNYLSEDPSMSQFTGTPQVPLSLTQHAQSFKDIVPSYSLTRFYSHLSHSLLLPLLSEALQRLGVPTPSFSRTSLAGSDECVWIKIKTMDGRHCALQGDILVEKTGIEWCNEGDELLEVRFVKMKGDPLEWRRWFKKVTVLCKEGVYVPCEE